MKALAKKTLEKIKYASALAALWLMAAPSAFAVSAGSQIREEFDEAAGAAFGVTGEELDQSLGEVVGGYINAALGLLGVILVVLIIYAGFLWMTAGGNADQVKKAKQLILNAVIGMIIIFAAYSITNFVLTNVLGLG